MTRRCAGGVAALLTVAGLFATAGCHDPAVETVRLRLSSPFAFDASTVQNVRIAVVSQPKQTCLRAAGTQVCGELSSVDAAINAEGYVTQSQIERGSGATATFKELPEGRTCFIADAYNGSGVIVANGCAEVDLRLDFQRIEIALASTP